MIQAIETHYKGYRFRSRLEARYAIFFDALGIKWLYENEGYKLPSGYYLPDFWFPEYEMHAEVKGQNPTAHEWQLCKELCESTESDVVVLDGLPSSQNYWGWGWMVYAGYIQDDKFYPKEDPSQNHSAECAYVFNSKGTFRWHKKQTPIHRFSERDILHFPDRFDFECVDISIINAARAARFEHGETPQIHIEPKHPTTSKPDAEFLRLCDEARGQK